MRHNNNYLSLVILAATLLFSSCASTAELPENPRDAYLAGAVTTWLEQSLGWAPGSYQLSVHDGLVTVTLPESDLQRRAVLEDAVPPMQGIEGINIVYGEAGEPLSEREQRVYSFLGLAPNTIPFPTGDIFWPLLADPKQPEFFVSWRRYKIEQEYFTTAAVGYGETFGLYRRAGKQPGDGLQIGIAGGLFAQFDLGAPSLDLVAHHRTRARPARIYAPPASATAVHDARRVEDRAALVRLGVASACAMNLMFLHGAIYAGDAAGMDSPYYVFFRWLSLTVAVPVLLFSARPFFHTAIAGLRAGVDHIDLRVAIALAVTFAASAWNVLRGSGPIYFDSLAMLVAALLGARQAQRSAQRAALERADSLRGVAFLEFARRLTGHGPDAPAVEDLFSTLMLVAHSLKLSISSSPGPRRRSASMIWPPNVPISYMLRPMSWTTTRISSFSSR